MNNEDIADSENKKKRKSFSWKRKKCLLNIE